MIEGYAFLAAFAVQILAMSVLYPAWFIRYFRVQMARLPAERLAQLYPGIDIARDQEHFLKRYRAMTFGGAVLGLLLMGWLFNYVRRPDWNDGPVELLVAAYFFVAQVLPLGLIIWLGVGFKRKYGWPTEAGKRKAVLQRRGLFDFVSPLVVVLAVVSYLLFTAFAFYVQRAPFPGYAGPLINIVIVTLVYVSQAFVVYKMLYGRNKNPFETHADRLHTIGLAVKSSVYSCIVVVTFLSLNFSLGLLDLQKWEPFALSLFLVITAVLACMVMVSPLRQPTPDELTSRPAT